MRRKRSVSPTRRTHLGCRVQQLGGGETYSGAHGSGIDTDARRHVVVALPSGERFERGEVGGRQAVGDLVGQLAHSSTVRVGGSDDPRTDYANTRASSARSVTPSLVIAR